MSAFVLKLIKPICSFLSYHPHRVDHGGAVHPGRPAAGPHRRAAHPLPARAARRHARGDRRESQRLSGCRRHLVRARQHRESLRRHGGQVAPHAIPGVRRKGLVTSTPDMTQIGGWAKPQPPICVISGFRTGCFKRPHPFAFSFARRRLTSLPPTKLPTLRTKPATPLVCTKKRASLAKYFTRGHTGTRRPVIPICSR